MRKKSNVSIGAKGVAAKGKAKVGQEAKREDKARRLSTTHPALVQTGLPGCMKFPLCACHASIQLNERQLDALWQLRVWVGEHGAQKLSSALIHGGSRGNKINNDLNLRFRTQLPSDLAHLSVLEAACHLAGINSEPGMQRNTTFEDDLEHLHRLYLDGGDCSEVALNANPRTKRLFARLKRRAGTASGRAQSWGAVVMALQTRYGGLQVRRFFRSLPADFYIDQNGKLCEFTDENDRRRVIRERIRELYEDGYSVAPGALKGIDEVWLLLRRNEKGSLIPLICEATNLPAEQVTHITSGARIYCVHNHTTCRDTNGSSIQHPKLRSNTEVAIDDCLAYFCGDIYVAEHQHDVKLESLVRNLDYVGSPYTGSRSPEVDIVLPGLKVAIEISHRSDLTRPGYKEKLEWKIAQLRHAGWSALTIHAVAEAEQRTTAQQVYHVLDLLQHKAALRDIQKFLTRYKGGKLTRFSFAEAKAEVRRLGITTSTEYNDRYKESEGLPSNPNKFYEEKWKGWSDFCDTPVPYENFADAHAAARGRFSSVKDYRRRRKMRDPRLPAAPEEMYRDKGWHSWPHFFGTLDAIHEPPRDLAELIPLQEAARQLDVSMSRVSALRNEEPGLQPTYVKSVAKRGENRCFYLQADIDAYKALSNSRRDYKLTFDDLAAELQRHGIRDTKAYERHHRASLERGEKHLPVCPERFYAMNDEFTKRGGWTTLFGLPVEVLPDDAMTPEEVAAYAGVSTSSVSQWRKRIPGLQPRVTRAYAPRGISRLVYSKRDVYEFLTQQLGWEESDFLKPQRRNSEPSCNKATYT